MDRMLFLIWADNERDGGRRGNTKYSDQRMSFYQKCRSLLFVRHRSHVEPLREMLMRIPVGLKSECGVHILSHWEPGRPTMG